jgi:hypothetical protein
MKEIGECSEKNRIMDNVQKTLSYNESNSFDYNIFRCVDFDEIHF